MARSTHHSEYQALLELLRGWREDAGLTQVSLALRLQNTQTFVSKIERGERRIDLIEFVELCEALGVDPASAFDRFLHHRSALKKSGRKLAKGK